jgi:hypothetical protein
MEEIKTVSISGGAAADISGERRRRNTKKKQEGGQEVHGVSSIMNAVKGIESTSSIASTAAETNSKSWLTYPTAAPVPPKINFVVTPSHIPSSPDKVAAPTDQYTQQGGNQKHVRVELKKKATVKKVHLNPKKAELQKSVKKHQTRKIRKVTLGISTLHKRITRAKKLHKKVKEMPIEALKAQLIKGGLIKPGSKAPEHILRQMAGDAEVVKNKAL